MDRWVRGPPPWGWGLLGLGGAIGIIVWVVFVEVRVVIVRPSLGNVSTLVESITTVVLAFTTIGSFLISLHTASRDQDTSVETERTFHFEDENNVYILEDLPQTADRSATGEESEQREEDTDEDQRSS